MRAAFLVAPKTIEFRDIPTPKRAENEALIRVLAAGVCGSDLHFYSAGRIGDVELTEPFVMGHEFSGVVEDPGPFADELPKGTRVAVDPSIACGTCYYCQRNRPNLCLNLVFVGFPPKSGGYAEFISLPRETLYPIPDSISDAEAPLVETLAVAVHTVELMGDVFGKSVAILGCGPVGLLTFQELRRCGARVAFMTDPVPSRREAALSIGVETALDPNDNDELKEQCETLDGVGPDLCD